MRRLVLTVLFAALAASARSRADEIFDQADRAFLDRIDERALRLLGVQYKGRIAILDSLARDQLAQVCGRRRIDDVDPATAYLELYFNAGEYLDRPVICVRERNMRGYVAEQLQEMLRQPAPEAGAARALEAFQRTGRLPPMALLDDQAREALLQTRRAKTSDFIRAGSVPSLRDALSALVKRPEFRVPLDRLSSRYEGFLSIGSPAMLPTREGRWMTPEDIPTPTEHAATRAATHPAPERVADADTLLIDLGDAWRRRDADQVNDLVRRLAETGAAVSPAYPSPAARNVELLYNRTYQSTIVWIGFAAALALLIVAAAVGRTWTRRLALGVFALSTAALLVGFVARWLLSGRTWYLPPIMNQFEAVTSSALLGAMLAIVLELIWKRNYFALAAAFYATVSLLCGFFLPGEMGAGISAPHGILTSPVMAVHVAVIIIAHALVGMTLPISLAYLGAVIFKGLGRGQPVSGTPDLRYSPPADLRATIDRCNLIVAQLACWSVAMGTILGAYWADFAWARWWGWDPKETWALITAMIYVAILHARFATPMRWRGLVTSLGCILGCGAMLFNWIVVNYYLSGKHSYA